MNLNKICPDCNAEYLPHIVNCADCGADLVLPEELSKAQEEKMRLAEELVVDRAVVREGELDWLNELRAVLAEAEIPATIQSQASCGKGCCGDTFQLVVSSDDLEEAQQRIEEYFLIINPELNEASELIREGRCPARRSPVGSDAEECPDCGLPLLIVEDEEE